jgi:hypothetical protein
MNKYSYRSLIKSQAKKKSSIKLDDLFDAGVDYGTKVLYAFSPSERVEAIVDGITTDDDGNVVSIQLRVKDRDADYYGLDIEQEVCVSETDTIDDIVGEGVFKIVPIE